MDTQQNTHLEEARNVLYELKNNQAGMSDTDALLKAMKASLKNAGATWKALDPAGQKTDNGIKRQLYDLAYTSYLNESRRYHTEMDAPFTDTARKKVLLSLIKKLLKKAKIAKNLNSTNNPLSWVVYLLFLYGAYATVYNICKQHGIPDDTSIGYSSLAAATACLCEFLYNARKTKVPLDTISKPLTQSLISLIAGLVFIYGTFSGHSFLVIAALVAATSFSPFGKK